MRTIRRALFQALDPAAAEGRLSPLNKALSIAIVGSVVLAVLETEPLIAEGRAILFHAVEIAFGIGFAAEYLARLWTAPERTRERPAWRTRLRWILSPMALIDLIAFLPLLLLACGTPLLSLRLIRLLRILRIANLGPMSLALGLVLRVVMSRRHELGATLAIGVVVLLIASTVLHIVEGAAQPAAFGSVPRALWWGVITLTTIGYGDAYPITPVGKIVAGLTALTGIGLIAAPTGILAAGFGAAVRHDPKPSLEAGD